MAQKKLSRIAVFAAIVLAVIFLPGISKYHQLRARQAKLDNSIKKLRVAEVGLRKEQDKLQKDPTYIEKVAREKLQVVNKGETIIKVKNGK